MKAQQKMDQEKISSQQNKIIELEKISAASFEKNKLLEERIKELISQNKLLAHEKWLLDCEKMQLIGQVEQVIKNTVVA